MTLLNIRSGGDSGLTSNDTMGILERVERVLAYTAVIGVGGAIGLILGVVAALMLGFIEIC